MTDGGEPDELDGIWRVLSDPTRRRLLDLLRDGPHTTGELCAEFPALSRFAVMKHLGLLEAAGLVVVRRRGRERWNHLNAVPLQAAVERWLSPFAARWAGSLLRLRDSIEDGPHPGEETDPMPSTTTIERGSAMGSATLRSMEIEQEVTIDAPQERVFDAITGETGNWWTHSFDDSPRAILLEPKVGGRFHEVWGDEQGALYASVTGLRRPSLLRLAGAFGMTRPVAAVITFELDPLADGHGTRVRLSHRAIGDLDEETFRQYDTGWRALLGTSLKGYVEGGGATSA
ncbi:MAG TPA: helix-turn-helix domain-containing protein [Acidimicrobiia bacterium]|nr:helix-turn-helix domain-containing protein [Acidimicrobiia bacterium]